MATRKNVDGKLAVAKTGAVGSGRHRPRSSIACNNCRARKVKCDVQKQIEDGICTKCRVADVECIVVHDGDRRKRGYHRHIAALKDRIQSLESMVVHHIRRNSEEAGEETHRVNEHETLPSSFAIPHSDSPPSSPCTCMSSSSSSPGADGNALLSTSLTKCSAVEAEVPHDGKIDPPGNSDPSQSSGPNSNAAKDQQSSVHSARAENDRLQLPDPNSNFTRIQLMRSSLLGAEEDVRNEAALNLDSSQVRKVLLEIAWRYLSLQTRLVHKQYFLSHRDLGSRSHYYSLFLENTLLACASRMSSSASIRSLGKPYIDRAVKDIPMELESPTLSTVQGFLLLADFEATQGRDRLGWTYMGIACRLILFDLTWDDRSESRGSKDELTLRRDTVYLSIFVYDTLWSLYLGRPRTMPLPMVCAVRDSAQAIFDNRILRVWVDLCVLIAEISDLLRTPPPTACQFIRLLLELDSRIQNAYEALPSDLAYRQISNVELDATGYAYHMQLCSTRIVLHHAIIKASAETETPLRESMPVADSVFQYTPGSSSKTMYGSAVCIVELATTYRHIFGPDKMITVMLNTMHMAAITLINHILVLERQGVYAESDRRQIRQLVDTLNQAQTHFPVAPRICQTISEVLNGTSSPSLLDCIPVSPTLAKSSLQPSVASNVNFWRAIGTSVERHAPPVALDFRGMFDERNLPWMPDMGDTFTVVS